jgi:hypothetical protein
VGCGWTLNLHRELEPGNVSAAQVAISAWIGSGNPDAAPEVIARRYVELHETRVEPELHHIALDR